MATSTKMTTTEARRVAVRPVFHAKCVTTIWFPRQRKQVETTTRWSLGQAPDGRWCATNGRDNGRWFQNREALDAYARFLSARDWEVAAA